MLNLDTTTTIALLVGVVLPSIVALVTKQLASSRFKSLTLLGLSAASTVLVPLVGQETVDLASLGSSFLTTFGVAVLAYYGIYKPTGTTDRIQTAIPGGLGRPVEAVTDQVEDDLDNTEVEDLIGEEVEDDLGLDFEEIVVEDAPVDEGDFNEDEAIDSEPDEVTNG